MRTGTILVLWLFLAIPSAGLLAQALGYPAVWGNHSNVVTDVVFPFPDLAGLLHLPSLLLFGGLLAFQPRHPHLARLALRLFALVTLLLALLLMQLSPPAASFDGAMPSTSILEQGVYWTQQGVLTLFLLTDASVALALSLLIPGLDTSQPELGPVSRPPEAEMGVANGRRPLH